MAKAKQFPTVGLVDVFERDKTTQMKRARMEQHDLLTDIEAQLGDKAHRIKDLLRLTKEKLLSIRSAEKGAIKNLVEEYEGLLKTLLEKKEALLNPQESAMEELRKDIDSLVKKMMKVFNGRNFDQFLWSRFKNVQRRLEKSSNVSELTEIKDELEQLSTQAKHVEETTEAAKSPRENELDGWSSEKKGVWEIAKDDDDITKVLGALKGLEHVLDRDLRVLIGKSRDLAVFNKTLHDILLSNEQIYLNGVRIRLEEAGILKSPGALEAVPERKVARKAMTLAEAAEWKNKLDKSGGVTFEEKWEDLTDDDKILNGAICKAYSEDPTVDAEQLTKIGEAARDSYIAEQDQATKVANYDAKNWESMKRMLLTLNRLIDVDRGDGLSVRVKLLELEVESNYQQASDKSKSALVKSILEDQTRQFFNGIFKELATKYDLNIGQIFTEVAWREGHAVKSTTRDQKPEAPIVTRSGGIPTIQEAEGYFVAALEAGKKIGLDKGFTLEQFRTKQRASKLFVGMVAREMLAGKNHVTARDTVSKQWEKADLVFDIKKDDAQLFNKMSVMGLKRSFDLYEKELKDKLTEKAGLRVPFQSFEEATKAPASQRDPFKLVMAVYDGYPPAKKWNLSTDDGFNKLMRVVRQFDYFQKKKDRARQRQGRLRQNGRPGKKPEVSQSNNESTEPPSAAVQA